MSLNQHKDPDKSRKKTKNPKYDPRVWETSDSKKSSKPQASKKPTDGVEQNLTTSQQQPPTTVQIPVGHGGSFLGASGNEQLPQSTGFSAGRESPSDFDPPPSPVVVQSPTMDTVGMELQNESENIILTPQKSNGIAMGMDDTAEVLENTNNGNDSQNKNANYGPSSPKDGHSPNSFANLFKEATIISKSGKLRFIPPVYTEIGTKHANIPDDLIIKQSEKWLLTLVGSFVGKRPAFQFVRFHAFRLWKKYGLVDVILNNQGRFYFKFDNADGLQFVIDNRPWLFNDIPVLLKKWEFGIEKDKIRPTSVHMWVNIYDLTPSMWDYEILSHITSVIGVPIALDRFTEEMIEKKSGRAKFARVLIKFNADQDIPTFIEAVALGKMMRFRLQNYWKPDRCSHCAVFGHKFIECADRPKPAEEMEATIPANVDKATDVIANDDGANAQGFQHPRRRKRKAKKGFPITSTKPKFQYVPKVTQPGKDKNIAGPQSRPQSPEIGMPDPTTWFAQRGVGEAITPNVETRNPYDILGGLNNEIGSSSYIPHDEKGRDDSEDEVYEEDNPTALFMNLQIDSK